MIFWGKSLGKMCGGGGVSSTLYTKAERFLRGTVVLIVEAKADSLGHTMMEHTSVIVERDPKSVLGC